jgi:hypothetical protein
VAPRGKTAPAAPIARGVTTFTEAIGAEIIDARKSGAKMRHCAEAAGVPWRTCAEWLERGRAWNAGDRSDIGARTYAAFAAEIDKASAAIDTKLSKLVLAGAEQDPKLAFEIMRWRAAVALRNAEARAAKAKARITEREADRADGTGARSTLEVPSFMSTPRIDPDAVPE